MTEDTLKVHPLLKKAGEDRNCPIHSGKAMKLAVFRKIMADIAEHGIEIKDSERQELWKEFDATPGWFGTNASAGRQAMDVKGEDAPPLVSFIP